MRATVTARRDRRRAEPVRPDRIGRPTVAGKFLRIDGTKFFMKGVTYGPFRPEADGCEYHTLERVERDFAAMRRAGVNTVRTYTPPPRWLLDCAVAHGLRVLIGIDWAQHIAFLDDRRIRGEIEKRVRDVVEEFAGHPAVLCYAVGNEIPAPIVRWYGARRIERFIHRLFRIAKRADPEALVTYVNYPTTEYLDLKFLDLQCFNVYLETPEKLEGYLARLQNIAADSPLLLGELGLDSMRNGEEKQASVLEWQIQSTFAAGCAGVAVFSWTDEWFRGGHDIQDWGFGLVTRTGEMKPALAAVANAFAEVPFPRDTRWPAISVVVCSYNGSRTIRETCEVLSELQYPNLEVVVVSDGSTDGTDEIVREFNFRLISISNGGLSNARNVGMQAATGEIVAYLDDDAFPDEHWLHFMAWSFMHSDHAGMGGPNIAPLDAGVVEQCVSHSPGGPNHVLLSDRIAEHIPGCNMSFRKSALLEVGGCDAQFRIAGDDVDLCWRIQDSGRTIGFSPAAMVWHHRRARVRDYLKQQYNYGRAEAMLAEKWPRRFNAAGHVSWFGRIYGAGTPGRRLFPRAIYQGTWGTAAFGAMYERSGNVLSALPLMPEWYLLVGSLLLLTVGGLVWAPLGAAAFLLLPVMTISVLLAAHAAYTAQIRTLHGSQLLKARLLIGFLHIAQPIRRLHGRLVRGLRPWRRIRARGRLLGFRPRPYWYEKWQSTEQRLHGIEDAIHQLGARTRRGGNFDRWDLDIRAGLLGGARVLMATEEHGAGKQLVRFRSWPKLSTSGVAVLALLALLCATALVGNAPDWALLPGGAFLLVLLRAADECLTGASLLQRGIERADGRG